MTLVSPPESALRKFLLGTLPPEEAESVAKWVEENPGAAERLRRIDARDTVVDALDKADTVGGTSPAPHSIHTAVRGAVPVVAPAGLPAEVGGYRVIRELGRGGMGVVLEAEDKHLRRRVAIKLIAAEVATNAKARARFLAEAQTLALINHPNVIPILHIGEDNGLLYIVMPLLRGETLDARLKRDKRLPADELVRFACEVAAGLAAAHAVGLVHRDIKPANIWLEAETGRAVVLDFGLAKVIANAADALTDTGAVVGTTYYMAPEQAEGLAVDARSDLFSLGAVLYQAATGQRPFKGETNLAVLIAVKMDTPPAAEKLNPNLTPQLAAVIRALLEKNPAARSDSAEAVIAALNEAAPAPAPVPRPRRRGTPLRWAVAAGLLLAVSGAAYGVWYVKTNEGILTVVEASEEADLRMKNGRIEVYGEDGKLKYTLAPGERDANLRAGPYTIKVLGADGVELDTSEFKMMRNGKVVIHVTAKPHTPPIPSPPSTDREVARHVLSLGGNVRGHMNGKDYAIWTTAELAELPQGPFSLLSITLVNKKLTEAELVKLRGCKNVRFLALPGCNVTDAGLVNFKGYTKLETLGLANATVTDAGLANFKGCKNLDMLYLNQTSVTDSGLVNFKDCKKLTYLNLTDTKITDAGLANFRNCTDLTRLVLDRVPAVGDAGLANFKGSKSLTILMLQQTKVTDSGLAYFKDCKNLQTLYIPDTKVTDAGLAHFRDHKKLASLVLADCPSVTDAGLAHLKECKALTDLDLRRTKVTASGIYELKKALPKCKIEPTDLKQ